MKHKKRYEQGTRGWLLDAVMEWIKEDADGSPGTIGVLSTNPHATPEADILREVLACVYVGTHQYMYE